MDNDATKLLQEIQAEIKGLRLYSVLLLLAIIGFSTLTMVMVSDLRNSVNPPPAQPAAAAPAK